MDSKVKKRLKYAYRQMDLAVDLLIRNICHVNSVTDWASVMGYSRAHFSRKFTKFFGENPKIVLRRAKFRKICRAIQSDWSATAYKIAIDTGMKNEKALHKFLNRNFEMGFLSLKDHLKRDVFRSRKWLSKAADEEIAYLVQNSHSSDWPSFPNSPDV